MKLSDGEKLTLLMLSELHLKLGIESEIDPKFIQSAIHNDQLWGIGWKYQGIPLDSREEPTPKIVKDVSDFLDMWSFIETAYKKMGQDDKQLLLNSLPHNFGNNPSFYGFDHNNEIEYASVLSFLIEDLERFTSFSNRKDLNSHMPTVATYSRMYSVFERIRPELGMRQLTVQELIEILSEKTHPSNR